LSSYRSARPLLFSSLLIALLLVFGAALVLFTYDFQAHKARLTEQLAQHLARPVQIGEVTFSLRHGPALSFSAVEIGSDQSDELYLRTEQLLLRIDWRSLWHGRMFFSDILLETPSLRISITPNHSGIELPATWLQDLAQAVQVDNLTVRNGSLRLRMPRDDAPAATIELQHLNVSFQQLSGAAPIGVQFSSHLAQQHSSAIVQGHGQLHPAANWQQTTLDLQLLVRQFQPGEFLAEIGLHESLPKLDGRADLSLRAHGSPTHGVQIAIASTSSGLSATLAGGQQLLLPKWTAQGRWRTTATRHALDDLRLDFDGLTFMGELRFDHSAHAARVEGSLSSSPLPLARLASLVPHTATAAPWLETLRTAHAGMLQFDSRFAVDQGTPLLRDMQLALWDGAFLLPGDKKVEALSLLATFAGNELGHFEGEALFQDTSLAFSGEIADWPMDHRQIRAEVQGHWTAEQFFAQLPETARPEGLRGHGPFPWQIAATGTKESLQISVRADLLQVALEHADFTLKEAGQSAQLLAAGEITPQRLTLQHGQLQLPFFALQARGHFGRLDQQVFQIVLNATVPDLRKLPAERWLDTLRPKGGLELHYRLNGAEGEIRERQGTLHLRRVGLHLGVIADLNDINGTLRLLDNRAESIGSVQVKIGDSPVKTTMRLRDFQHPVLELQVEGEAIRANELIFPSERMILREVSGGLRISGEGLDFQGIRVRLDGGTKAVVDGSLRNYAEPVLELEVAASYGNIDEVIALWQRRADPPPHAANKHGVNGSYRIQAKVQQGQLGDLRFEEASGAITLPGDDLLIYPLRFQVGSGQCVGQVLLANMGGSAPILKISGAVENFDAAAIYSQLLKRRGLVSGTMRGDFHLQGEVGENFLASSSGGIDVEVQSGVLRKFRFISKVFSILNVSQILSFKLPDMAEEGMPFRRLSATFALKEGVLSTENLFIDSNAMNLSLLGDIDLRQDRLDLLLGVKPLRTVDRIVTRIPLAGWLLTGEEKALITAHFQIRGSSDDPEVVPVPITSLSETVVGIFSRVLGLPGKLIDDLGSLMLESESATK
jgi:hypothetical protein